MTVKGLQHFLEKQDSKVDSCDDVKTQARLTLLYEKSLTLGSMHQF